MHRLAKGSSGALAEGAADGLVRAAAAVGYVCKLEADGLSAALVVRVAHNRHIIAAEARLLALAVSTRGYEGDGGDSGLALLAPALEGRRELGAVSVG